MHDKENYPNKKIKREGWAESEACKGNANGGEIFNIARQQYHMP